MIKKINHVGIITGNLENTLKMYQKVFGLIPAVVKETMEGKLKVAFVRFGDNEIELLQPVDQNLPMAKFLLTKGQGIHHICLEVDDIEAEVKAFLEKGATMVDQKPRPGAHNTRVAFVHPKSSGGVLIELCEFPKKV